MFVETANCNRYGAHYIFCDSFTFLEPVLVKIKPRLQMEDKINLLSEDRNVNVSLSNTFTFLSTTNTLSESYTYLRPVGIRTHGSYWDLGSLWCDSMFGGMCDAFIKIPDGICSGPGCGEGMWQNMNRQCTKLSDYKYSLMERKNRDFIWPDSLYGKYSSTCNPRVNIKFERNCR